MLLAVTLIAIYALPVFIYYLYGAKNNFSSSDHHTHQLFIDLIRENGYLFIRKRGNIINENYMAYPQLMHWFIAIMPGFIGNFFVRYLQIIVTALMGAFHFLFIWKLYPHIAGSLHWPPYMFAVSAALIFVLTPYSFNFNNAKNRGLSSRGLGVMLGQLFVYGLILWKLEQNYLWLIAAGVIVTEILLINRFAYQYVLFGTPFFALFFQDVFVASPLVGGTVIFLILFPRIAVSYFKGQWDHKKVYSKYLAQRFILRSRKSIWGDFIFEFPIRTYRWLVDKPWKKFDQLHYVFTNPAIMIIVQIPFLVLAFIFTDYSQFWKGQEAEQLLLYAIIVSLILFVLTSFRFTRFLGEPERYVEFAIAPLSIYALLVIDNIWFLTPVLVFCVVLIIRSSYTFLTRVVTSKDISDIIEVRDFLVERSKNRNVKVLCTHTQDKKVLRVAGIKQFDYLLSQEYSSGFHVKEVFPENYDLVNFELLGKLITKLELNHLVTRSEVLEEVTAKLHAGQFVLEPVTQTAEIHVLAIRKS